MACRSLHNHSPCIHVLQGIENQIVRIVHTYFHELKVDVQVWRLHKELENPLLTPLYVLRFFDIKFITS